MARTIGTFYEFFSGAGLKGERSGTFWPFWDLMAELDDEGRVPAMIVLENVCGTLTSHGGKDFVAICRTLHDGGYNFGGTDKLTRRPGLALLDRDLSALYVDASAHSERMWTEYAEKHQGVSLRIQPNLAKDSKFQLFRPVIYREKRPTRARPCANVPSASKNFLD